MIFFKNDLKIFIFFNYILYFKNIKFFNKIFKIIIKKLIYEDFTFFKKNNNYVFINNYNNFLFFKKEFKYHNNIFIGFYNRFNYIYKHNLAVKTDKLCLKKKFNLFFIYKKKFKNFFFKKVNLFFFKFFTYLNYKMYLNVFNVFNNFNIFFSKQNFFNQNNNLIINYFNFFKLNKFNLFLYTDFFYKHLNLHFLNKNINKNVNNTYPIFFFKNINLKFFKKFNFLKKHNFIIYINLFLIKFLEFYFKKKFFVKFLNNNIIKQKNVFLHLNEKYEYLISFNKYFLLKEFIKIIWISLEKKDLFFLSCWIKKNFELIYLYDHKKFFNLIQELIINNFELYQIYFKIKGFYFCVRGKINLSGNAKKKVFFFKKGCLKLSSKINKIEHKKFNLNTLSGSLGLEIVLTY